MSNEVRRRAYIAFGMAAAAMGIAVFVQFFGFTVEQNSAEEALNQALEEQAQN